ncbi:bifunctional 2-polyprenyl-6-hydroxyphenol methylase/3-demethylubiquinol 3-O-methyltransferase UbiG [Bacillus sp. S/N-304-OC-R1]|uniref:class I SAM-dependent methyltransferase n=1 Tax=Bacillus sp. S/N-304-OC-R1 TaxID=2758034 RepID=UPI001C8D6BCE|nr:class I SAM-dependent methyltransferase [Bacillus sp. S/N-304-OC-R1]MBY0122794.1 methyltransferase domain-containing protein [Bacillus sp. S/N-304-OC-R1]
MGIDFHDQKNHLSYATREADRSWVETIRGLIQVEDIKKAVDIGCGGGIYLKALSDMGILSVTGVDFSEVSLEGAKENCKEYENIFLHYGNAVESGLPDHQFQLLLERALIHHITDLEACFAEAYRILEDDGTYIIQDRTPEDCLLEGNEKHIRGYFFEAFPRLIDKEIKRRHSSEVVIEKLKEAGFRKIQEVKLWEVRKIHNTKQQLLKDLHERTGRSILHELDDHEIATLISYIDNSISEVSEVVEKDRWTIWKAVK